MNIEVQQVNGITVLPFEGRLDGNNASVAEQTFLGLFAEGRRNFVFDFGGLQYISSAGLRIVLVAAKKLRSGEGRMVCASLNDQVRDVFEMSGFTTILEIADTTEEALGRFEGNA